MACNCAGKGKANVSGTVSGSSSGNYSLTMPDGTRTFYDTETAARAANQQMGGGGLIRRIS